MNCGWYAGEGRNSTGKQGKCLYKPLQKRGTGALPVPRFACWGESPSPKTHPANRMAAHLRCFYAGRLSLVLLRSLRSWRSLLRGKIRPQFFPVREQFPRLFPRVAVRRVSLFFLRNQLTVFHIERLFRRELLQPKLVERTLCRAVPVDLLLMLVQEFFRVTGGLVAMKI